MPITHDQFTNFATTTLAGGAGGGGTTLNATDTTCTLTDASSFPATTNGSFMMLLNSGSANELVKCTSRTGNTLNLVRGQEGTTAQAFSVGSTVTQELTAGNLANVWTRLQEWPVNVRDAGAVADGVADNNCAITAATATLTTTTSPGPFTSAMTGRSVLVRGAGASGGDLWATATYVSATQLTLSANAVTTVSGATAYVVNTDDFPALSAAMTAVLAAGGGDLYLPAGVYLVDIHNASNGAQVTGQNHVRIRGAGRNATILVCSGTTSSGAIALFTAAAGASLSVEDMTIVAPPNAGGFSCRGIWHLGTAGRLAAYRVNAWNWGTALEADTGASVEVVVDDCDFSLSPVLNLGTGACNILDIARFTATNTYIRAWGVAASNQNHGMYIHQGVDAEVRGCRFGQNNGVGFSIQFFGGAGTSPNASVVDCYFSANSYIGVLTNPTVRTRIVGCRFLCANKSVYVQFDADVVGCEFDGVATAQSYITQLGATAASKVNVYDCWFNLPATTGTAALVSNIAANVWRATNCIFTCNQAAAFSNSGGGLYLMSDCAFADDGIGHVIEAGGGTPTLTAVNANVTAQSVAGNDVRGVISFNTQTATIAPGTALFTLNFAVGYGAVPVVVVSNQSNVTTGQFYVAAVSATVFNVYATATLAIATGYKTGYIVIG